MKYVLYALLAWFLYQFIFKLVIPIYTTSRKIKKGFREMQEKMNDKYQPNEQAQTHAQPKSSQTAPRPRSSDYIDFEEVK